MVKDREAWRATGHDLKESDMTERLNRHKGFCVVKDEDFVGGGGGNSLVFSMIRLMLAI